MIRVLATGTFDLLHPGHVYYLEESRRLGDELYVIVSREKLIEHKRPPTIPEKQRRDMVAALDPVDHAILGSEESIFDPLYEIKPDIITVGYDQYHSVEDLKAKLESLGFDMDVVRINKKTRNRKFMHSSTQMKESILGIGPDLNSSGWRGFEEKLATDVSEGNSI